MRIDTRRLIALFLAAALIGGCAGPAPDFREATIPELAAGMGTGELSSEQLVRWYLDRIEEIDRNGPTLNAVIEVNPDALLDARALDEERAASGARGPLHGIPVLLKANIDTADRLHTSAGSLLLADHVADEDAFLVSRLRDAGVVILGKANLSEWANFRSTRSVSGWSSVGGQTRNPYAPRRNPCGSSSGSAAAVAANLAAIAVGTETDGSIVCPSGANGIVGIKPTLGLVSRAGIIPIAHSQDTAGPMARTVTDAALLMSAMAGPDPDDAATRKAPAGNADYAAALSSDALAGRRIGVIRSHHGADENPRVTAILEAALETMRAQGAEVVDDISIDMSGVSAAEYEVLLYEFKADLEKYLAGSGAPVTTLAEVIAWNEAHADDVMPWFGQEIFIAAEKKGGLDEQAYLDALAASGEAVRERLDATFDEHGLDALVGITNAPAWLTDPVNGDHFLISSSSYAAVSGYPAVSVPAGFVAGLPVGISFIGRAWDDRRLIGIAYAFEQATGVRRPPTFDEDVTD